MGLAQPGLKGPKGKLTLIAMDHMDTLYSVNPDIVTIQENVSFQDLTSDWKKMTKRMGSEPYILDSANFSTTRRKRAWWTRNLTMDADLLTPPSKRPNPDDCMDSL